MRHGRLWIGWAVLGMGLAGCSNAMLVKPVYVSERLEEKVVEDAPWVNERILVLDVDGLIMNVNGSRGLFGLDENPVAAVKEKLDIARDDGRIRGVVLRVNSPGGSVTASDVIHREILSFREETKKPVVCCMMDVAASGGYYAAVACDKVVAHPTTVTGSIGVVMHLWNVRGLTDFLQIRQITIKSGPRKDMGSPFRELTAEERKILQHIIDSYHKRFVQVVAEGRPGLDEAAVATLADGRVYTAEQALELKLVDRIGYLSDAVAEVKALAGIDKAKVVIYNREFGPKNTIYSSTPIPAPRAGGLDLRVSASPRWQAPQFLYLWAPGW